MDPKSSRTIPQIVVTGIVAIAVMYFGCMFVVDQLHILKIKQYLSWLEKQYTVNAYYPSKVEFQAQFPEYKPIGPYYGYEVSGSYSQGFRLYYKLHSNRFNAPGVQQTHDFFGGYAQTYVDSCPRWEQFGFRYSGLGTLINLDSLDNYNYFSIVANFAAGEIQLVPTYASTSKVYAFTSKVEFTRILLGGVKNPRISKYGQGSIIVTNGNDVIQYDIKYDLDPANISLVNPRKIGTVPTDCPPGYST